MLRAQLLRRDLLEHLYHHGQLRSFRFAQKQVHVLRHHDITDDAAAVPHADSIEFCFESVFCRQTIEQWHAAIATERDERQAALVLIVGWFDVHSVQIVVSTEAPSSRKKTREGWGNPKSGIPCERSARCTPLGTSGTPAVSFTTVNPP